MREQATVKRGGWDERGGSRGVGDEGGKTNGDPSASQSRLDPLS